MSTNEGAVFEEKRTGLEDVVRSVRALARSSRKVAEAAAHVAERELAMAITISERLRDSVVSAETLRHARAEELPAKMRDNAHRVVDLVADIGAVAFSTAIRFVEGFVDEPRKAIDTVPAATST